MNLLRIVLFSILLAMANIASAQNKSISSENVDNNKIDCKSKFDTAKELYAKMFNSPSGINYRTLRKRFFDKTHNPGRFQDQQATTCKENILLWIKANIQKTDFSNYEEAKREWEAKEKSREIYVKENQEFYNYMEEIKGSCGEYGKTFFLEMIEQYGNEFFI